MSDLGRISEEERAGADAIKRLVGKEGDYDDESATVEAIAAARGKVVVYPADDELQLDLDGEDAVCFFREQMVRFNKEVVRVVKHTITPSTRPGHWHATLKLERSVYDEVERVLFQALLGSDRVRELLTLVRARRGDKRPSRLFEVRR